MENRHDILECSPASYSQGLLWDDFYRYHDFPRINMELIWSDLQSFAILNTKTSTVDPCYHFDSTNNFHYAHFRVGLSWYTLTYRKRPFEWSELRFDKKSLHIYQESYDFLSKWVASLVSQTVSECLSDMEHEMELIQLEIHFLMK